MGAVSFNRNYSEPPGSDNTLVLIWFGRRFVMKVKMRA